MAGAGAKPSPGPLLPIPVGRCSVFRLGIALDCVVSAVAASYTPIHRVGGWGVLGYSMSLSSMVLENK